MLVGSGMFASCALRMLSFMSTSWPWHAHGVFETCPSHVHHIVKTFPKAVHSMYKLVHRHVNAHVQNLSNTCRFNLFMSTYVCCYEHPSWTVLVPYIHLTLTFPTPRTLCTYPYQSITLHIHIHQIPYTCPFFKLYSIAFPSTSIYLHLSSFVYLVNPSQFIIIAINLHIPDWNLQQWISVHRNQDAVYLIEFCSTFIMFMTIAVIVHFNHHTFHIIVVIYVQLQFSHQDPRYMRTGILSGCS